MANGKEGAPRKAGSACRRRTGTGCGSWAGGRWAWRWGGHHFLRVLEPLRADPRVEMGVRRGVTGTPQRSDQKNVALSLGGE